MTVHLACSLCAETFGPVCDCICHLPRSTSRERYHAVYGAMVAAQVVAFAKDRVGFLSDDDLRNYVHTAHELARMSEKVQP